MKTLYTWNTPNGRKISIALEEMGFDYEVRSIDITKDEQMSPEFLALNSNHKIPVLVDDDLVLPESNAILLYLASLKEGYAPAPDHPDHWRMMQWLMWQASGFGPMLGQAHHFLHYNQGKSEYSEARFHAETKRLYGILDTYLENRQFMLTDFSILEFAIWPWVSRFGYHRIDLNDFPNVRRWYLQFCDRPGFINGYSVPDDLGPIPLPN